MSDPNEERGEPIDAIASEIARARRAGAETSDEAVIVGDRAGVVAWVNAAWSRITGFPTAETVRKPIGHFLDRAGIELELVDFVGRRFVEGLSCRLQFPFETFEGRAIRVDLEVTPVRGASGELDAFRATARVLPEPPASDARAPRGASRGVDVGARHAELRDVLEPRWPTPDGLDRPSTDARPPGVAAADPARSRLSNRLHEACARRAALTGPRVHFDLVVDPERPLVDLDHPTDAAASGTGATAFDDLVESLLDAALAGVDDSWGTVTLVTGRTRRARGHVSLVHPIIARPRALAAGPHAFLEVHDTGTPLDPDFLARLARGEGGAATPREVALVRARAHAQAIGATLHVDSRPGCGSQSLVLLPIARR
jgi:hypothetical protein